MPILAIDLDGLEPLEMISHNGSLSESMIVILTNAISYDESVIRSTKWMRLSNAPYPLVYSAIFFDGQEATTLGNTVVYDASKTEKYTKYSISYFRLILHEQTHRQQIQNVGGNYRFYSSYFLEFIDRGYRSNSFEEEAYRIGFGKEDIARSIWNYKGSFSSRSIGDIIMDRKMPNADKLYQLKGLSLEFSIDYMAKRANMLSGEISIIEKQIESLNNVSSKSNLTIITFLKKQLNWLNEQRTETINQLENKKSELKSHINSGS